MTEPDSPDADPVAVAREIALRQLTVRARTRTELARALARKQVPAEAAEVVIDRLAEVGLIDDEVFARDWLAAGVRRQKSRRSLLAELDADRDIAVARAFADRKARSLAGLDRNVAYRRLAGALARRGFSPGVVAQVTREAMAGTIGLQNEWDEP